MSVKKQTWERPTRGANENEMKVTDEEAKQSFLSPAFITLSRNIPEPVIYRRAVDQHDSKDLGVVNHPSASSSSNVPSLPMDINKSTLIEINSNREADILSRLTCVLEKRGSTTNLQKHTVYFRDCIMACHNFHLVRLRAKLWTERKFLSSAQLFTH